MINWIRIDFMLYIKRNLLYYLKAERCIAIKGRGKIW